MHCLGSAYSDRIHDLEQTALQVGPFLFTVSAQYHALVPEPLDDSDNTGNAGRGIGTREVRFPRIDGPVTPVTMRWNTMNVRRENTEGDCEGPGDEYQTSKIGFASSRIISVEWTSWFYCHGTPHGHGGTRTETLVLLPEPHALKAEDIFRTDRPWQSRLNALVTESVRRAFVEDFKREPKDLDQNTIAGAVSDPRRWTVSADGLRVGFDSYELGQGYPFAPTVTISWSELKDVIVGDPLAP